MSMLTEQADRLRTTVDDDNLLGQLLWYSMSEVRVPHADAVTLMNAQGILSVPLPPKDGDVFKRVCSGVKRVKVPTDDPEVFENYRMVEFKDDTTITRRVIRERVNSAGKKLSVDERFDIDFNRDTAFVKIRPIAVDYGHYDDVSIGDQVKADYDTWKGCLNAYGLRQWLRGKVMGLGATMVRPGGGVYFVQQDRVSRLAALEAFGLSLQPYCVDQNGAVEFHSLPLVDDRKQRDMIQKAFEAETVGAIDEVMVKIQELKGGKRKVSTERYAALVTQYQDLVAKTEDYENLLENKLASTQTRLELFDLSLRSLLGRVKTDA